MSETLLHFIAGRVVIGMPGAPRSRRMYWRNKSGLTYLGLQDQGT